MCTPNHTRLRAAHTPPGGCRKDTYRFLPALLAVAPHLVTAELFPVHCRTSLAGLEQVGPCACARDLVCPPPPRAQSAERLPMAQ